MNAAKKNARSGSLLQRLATLARPPRGGGRHAIVGLLLLGLCATGFWFAWKKWGQQLTEQPQYRLTAESIEITPSPPSWIHADIKAEVVRDAGLSQWNVLDEQLTVKVASAFAVHTWVARVARVSKHYGPKLIVTLEYRRPVAMVEVTDDGRRGLLPVDPEGILLPPDDFSPNEVRNFLRIWAGQTKPAGPVGTPWGDGRVAGAARIAEIWSDRWKKLDLYRIVARPDSAGDRKRGEAPYELSTRLGTRVVWGSPPGQERSGELAAPQKIARLVKFVQQNGSLDGPEAPAVIDLRDHAQLRVTPRTAGLGRGQPQ